MKYKFCKECGYMFSSSQLENNDLEHDCDPLELNEECKEFIQKEYVDNG